MQTKTKQNKDPMGITALYCRLSRDDGAEGESNSIANEYCQKFAQVGMLKLEERALVKMTRKMIDELAMAKKVNLQKIYLENYYIYQVDELGNPEPFEGIEGELTQGGTVTVTEPCIKCTKHTKEMWEEYKKENPWVDNPTVIEPGNQQPAEPEQPSDQEEEKENWWDKIWPF